MKHLETLNGVQELSNTELVTTEGGKWGACQLAYEIGKAVGSLLK